MWKSHKRVLLGIRSIREKRSSIVAKTPGLGHLATMMSVTSRTSNIQLNHHSYSISKNIGES